VQPAIDQWLAARRQEGWKVSVERDVAPSLAGAVDASTRVYRVGYTDLTWLGYLHVMAATNPELPVPPALHQNCQPRAFDFRLPAGASVAAVQVFLLAGWYMAIVVLAGWSLRGQADRRETRDRQRWRSYFRWIGFGLATTAAVMLIARGLHVLFGIDLKSGQRESILALIRSDPWLLYLFALVGPFCEELLFRGWLLRDFVVAGMARSGSVVVSVSFAGMHMTGDVANASTSAYATLIFLISIVLCWVYVRYRSLLASTLTHMAHNAASMAIALLVT
jgi:membrane protease YdiL (CAAX protease family)